MERHNGKQLKENKQRSDVILFILKGHYLATIWRMGELYMRAGIILNKFFLYFRNTGR